MDLSSIIDWMDLLIFVLAILGSIGVIYAGFQLYNEDQQNEVVSDLGKNKSSQIVPTYKPKDNISDKKPEKVLQKPLDPKKAETSFADKVLEKALEAEIKKNPKPIIKKTQELKKPLEQKKPLEPKKAEKKAGFANPKTAKKKKGFLSFWRKEESSKAELLGEIMPPVNPIWQKQKDLKAAPELIPEQLTLRSPQSINLKLKVKGNKLLYKKIRQGSYNELKINYQPSLGKKTAKIGEYPTGNTISFSIDGENVISKTYQFTIFFGDQAGNTYSQQIAGLGKEYPIVDKPQKVGS